jgi:hypothetical protein
MKRFLIALTATLMTATACHAAAIYTCTTDEVVSFQSTPCPEATGDDSALLAPSARIEMPSDEDEDESVADVPAAAPKPVAAKPSRGKLQIGVTDMQVLNNRHWGKPQQITRNREARAWHEYWIYEAGASDAEHLHFVNGKLAGVGDVATPVNEALMVPAVLLAEREPKS